MRPGCIFVSHRSILIWLICFFYAFSNIALVFGFFSPFVFFWMLYFFFFNFPKKSCFSEALLLVMSIWWVEGLNFHTVRFYWKVAELKWLLSGQWITWNMIFVGFCVRWAVWVLSEVQWRLQHTLRSLPTSLISPSHQLCLSPQVYFYSHHLLLTVIFNSLNLPFQHAQSKDIFPHLCIISGVHFFICVILVWW